MGKIIKYFLLDILKNKIIIGLTAFFWLASFSLFYLDENNTKAILSLMNIVIMVVPLISMIFAGNYYFNSYEFKEVLLSLPLTRKKIIVSELVAVSSSIALSILFGLGLPAVIFGANSTVLYLILMTIILSVACVSVALWIVIRAREKSRGMGLILMAWFYFTLIYDLLILTVLMNFSDYPLEKWAILLACFNPIDLCRISIMLKLDISALMGYTGALYKEFFSSFYGQIFTLGVLTLWIIIPAIFSIRFFNKKDL